VGIGIDVNTLFYLVEAGLIGLLGGVILGRRTRPRSEEKAAEPGQEAQGVEKPGKPYVFLEEAIGLDKAMAHKFYVELRKAIREKKVRVALVSDSCPKGRIAYDFVRETWICVEKDGTSYPLGEKPAPELLTFYDEGLEEGEGVDNSER